MSRADASSMPSAPSATKIIDLGTTTVATTHLSADGTLDAGDAMQFAARALTSLASSAVATGKVEAMSINCDFVGTAQLGDVISARGTVTRHTRTVLFLAVDLFKDDHLILTASSVYRINR